MRKQKIKKPIIDWIQFDSDLEWKIYLAFKEKKIQTFPWLEELKGWKICGHSLEYYEILPAMAWWKKKFRALKYTPDFEITNWKEIVVLEVKSKWTASKPDYKLRMKIFLSLYGDKLKFAELIQHNTKKYEFIKYF